MIEANNSDHNSDEADSGHHNSKPSYLRWVFIFGGIGIAGLLAASVWWPNLTERTKFFTGNLLNLIIALAVIAQVLIYRKQRDVMERQWRAMEGQLEVMRNTLSHSRRTYEANWTMFTEERRLAGEQLEAMQAQLQTMKDQTELAGKQADLASKQVELMVRNESAYIRVGDIQPHIKNHLFFVTGKLFNGGRTPAWQLTRAFGVAFVEESPPPGWKLPWEPCPDDEILETGTLVVGDSINFETDPIKVTDETIKRIIDGSVQIVLEGECGFYDSLGGRQVYTFGLTLNMASKRAFLRHQHHRRENANPENPN